MTSRAEPTLTLDIFIHMDAGDRKTWTLPEDEVPLTDLGRRQAQRMADELCTAGPVDAVYSSPAVRCRQSLESLAQRLGMSVTIAPGFNNTNGYKAPDGWARRGGEGPDPLGAAASAGRAFGALQQIREAFPQGRAVVCSHGDIVPVFLAFLSDAYGAKMPARVEGKGAVYTVRLQGGRATIESREPSAGFPG